MTVKQRLSAEDRAALEAMLEAPEVIEFHGKDREWRSGLLGSVLSAGAMTFMMATSPAAHAQSYFERTMSSIATSTATNAIGNLVRQGIQGTADIVKKEVVGVPQAGQGRPGTVFSQGAGAVSARVAPAYQTAAAQPAHEARPPVAGYVQSGQPAQPRSKSLVEALGFGGSDIPASTADLAAAMDRNDVNSIADTAALRPVLFPVVVAPGASEYAQLNTVAALVTSAVQAGPRGQSAIRDGLMQGSASGKGPSAAIYVTENQASAACMIVMRSGQADSAELMSKMTGLSKKESIDFAVLHEAALCAQQGETVAAQYDATTGKASQARARMAASGLVDVTTEAVIKSGQLNRLAAPQNVERAARSSERYADAFAALALNAQRPLSGQQWNGLTNWRATTGTGYDTGNFLAWVQDQLQRDPAAFDSMRSGTGAGFNARAIAGFLQPVWKTFEAREAQLDQERERANRTTRIADRTAPAENAAYTRPKF